jgi:DNA repair exonuclease SbcCD nuclease subunit
MKVIILGDCHNGARNGSSHFVKFFNSFFDDCLYPYMREHDIKEIFQLGDCFDNRTQLNLAAFHSSKPSWFDPLVEYGYHMHVLLGNHDITHRESLKVNTPESVLQEYIRLGVMTVYKNPTSVTVDDNTTFDIVPWICKENKDEVLEFLSRSEVSDICLGHFEIQGASMYKGVAGHGGLSHDLFGRYEKVLSGHYHTRSFLNDDQIHYVGTPYEITWQDAHDPRGFTVFDTVTRQYEFVPNPRTTFQKIYYRGQAEAIPDDVKGKFVKLIVEDRGNPKEYDKFYRSLQSADPLDISVFESKEELLRGEVSLEDFEIEDTAAVISKYIDSIETSIDKDKVKNYINGLFNEAIKK